MSCKDCKNCEKKGLLILPVRYAAIVSDNPEAYKSVPTFPSKLGAGVTDIALKHSTYGLRMMREGYLYVLIEKNGAKYWQAYLVLESGQLSLFESETPPSSAPESICFQPGLHSFMVSIENAQQVPNAWFVFTDTPMTPAKLDEYKKNAESHTKAGKMQHFSPQQWMGHSTQQPHTLQATEVRKQLVEYILYDQGHHVLRSPLGIAMQNQLYPALSAAYAGVPTDDKYHNKGRLGLLHASLIQNQAAVFAVHDSIGITQELNDFRNAPLGNIQTFLNKKDQYGTDNQRKLDISGSIESVEKAFKELYISGVDDWLQTQKNFTEDRLTERQGHARYFRNMGRHAEADHIEKEIVETRRAQAEGIKRMQAKAKIDAPKKWNSKYLPLLDKAELDNFRNTLSATSKQHGDIANSRAPDHLAWIKSDRLVNAFDTYDKAHLGSGVGFAHDYLLCTYGMFGVPSNQPTLAQWMNTDTVERKNLYLRTSLYNQKDLEKAAHPVLKFARNANLKREGIAELIFDTNWLSISKNFVSLMKKADSAWDEWLRDNTVKYLQSDAPLETKKKDFDPKGQVPKLKAEQPKVYEKFTKLSRYHKSAEAWMYAHLSSFSQAISSKAGHIDKGIEGVVVALLYNKLGKLTESISIEDTLLNFSKETKAKLKAQREQAGQTFTAADQQQVDAATQAHEPEARRKGKADAAAVKGSIGELIKDEQKKVRDKVQIALEDLGKPKNRPETNNFHQARLGILLMSLEGLSLSMKLRHHDKELTLKEKAEIAGSIMSLTSMATDVLYSVVKSVREIKPFKDIKALSSAFDITRGGLKMFSGTLSTAAGVVSFGLDITTSWQETQKERSDWLLASIYFSRSIASLYGAYVGFIAAFSYTGPLLKRLAEKGAFAGTRFAPWLARAGAYAADKLAIARTLWLLRVARANAIGLAITVGEVVYTCFIKDNELENWCQACTFRKQKKQTLFTGEKPYPDAETEQKALENAFKALTGVPEKEEQRA